MFYYFCNSMLLFFIWGFPPFIYIGQSLPSFLLPGPTKFPGSSGDSHSAGPISRSPISALVLMKTTLSLLPALGKSWCVCVHGNCTPISPKLHPSYNTCFSFPHILSTWYSISFIGNVVYISTFISLLVLISLPRIFLMAFERLFIRTMQGSG